MVHDAQSWEGSRGHRRAQSRFGGKARTGLVGRQEQGDGRTALEGIAEMRISQEAR